jgi:alpha-pyrone synthase
MSPAITAIGIANPKFKLDQKEAADLVSTMLKLTAAEKKLLKSIYRATGIDYRYSALSDFCKKPGEFEFFPNDADFPFPSTAARMAIYKENALELSLNAIDNCFASLPKFNKEEITHIIVVSCTGMYAPGIDIEIIHSLHLKPNTKRTAIQFMGCYGAFNGIKTADAICKADPTANVLLVCVELCTIHFQKNMSIENMISNSIFADGAAAVLIQANADVPISLSLQAFHCDLLPQTQQEMAWKISDSGFDIILSNYVPDMIKTGIAAFTQRLLENTNLSLNEIDFYAIHPGGIKILQACEEALNITKKDNYYAYSTLKNYGNMSSATILFVLKNLWNDLQSKDHNKIIFSCAFGPGLTLESMILKTNC